MDNIQQSADLLEHLKTIVRPLYTEITVLKVAINAIKLSQPAQTTKIDQMIEFARRSEDTAKEVDLELAQLSTSLVLLLPTLGSKSVLPN